MKLTALALAAALGTFSAVPAFAQPPTSFGSLEGVWTNTNPATRSIVRIVIKKVPGGITVQPFGACSPTPCDHGVIRVRAFAPGVSSALATGFSGIKRFGFKFTQYNGYMQNRRLTLMTQDTFTGGETRFDYTVMEHFVRTALTEESSTGTQVPGTAASSSDLN